MILTGERSLPGEEWRPVVGSEGKYSVSNLGRVYSIPRHGVAGGLLQITHDGKGYPIVCVTIVATGRRKCRKVHRLVAQAFLPTPSAEQNEVRHLNDVKDDCRLENLAWGTKSDNMRDAVRNLRHWNTAKTHCHRGHAFTPENTITTKGGARQCRECDLARKARRRAHIREQRSIA